jgi:hypothetical protein
VMANWVTGLSAPFDVRRFSAARFTAATDNT